MANLLSTVDQRTRLVGENRLELLLFRLGGAQLFAINVFKVQEVVKMPRLRRVPHSYSQVCGVTQWRGQTIPVLDLSAAIGARALPPGTEQNLIVTEYNRSVQAFMTGPVDRIVNLNWEEVLPPPEGAGRGHFLTSITRVDGRLVEILDVERVLAEVAALNTAVSDQTLDHTLAREARARGLKVLLAEDSATAVAQVRETLSELGLELIAVQDGLKALRQLQAWVAEGKRVTDEVVMLITDAEMPEMDGYRLTAEIRQSVDFGDLHVVMHTSLSGGFNQAMVSKVGCDAFLSKFAPDELASVVQARLKAYLNL
ncbi:two-component system chemotaxis response regulator CheV [Marinimicrobium koreense]|uniref:Two-component system chemotaxis response regulator CheV n=1 Tax=Marinimicrobium koreense TaxID=306545 RepID=A0A3N1NWX6_9GAMM|nr:chemotaxis protein [Marinimicrobium koreense]ROQ20329.1 two-component system chemotaxis response regulator CheV [Marinimicrobium koreense]